jgi:hypothetical protein
MKKITLTPEQWMAIVRHTLTFTGGVLLTAGVVSAELWAEVSGAILGLAGTIWSIIEKKA